MEEELDEIGSIADFIDRTIVRCLIELEGGETNPPAAERTKSQVGEGPQRSSCQEHCQNKSPASQTKGQAADSQTGRTQQACWDQAAECRGQPQRPGSQAERVPHDRAVEPPGNPGSQEGSRFSPVPYVPESSAEKETVRGDDEGRRQRVRADDVDSAGSNACFTSFPGSERLEEPEDLTVPREASSGLDRRRRLLPAPVVDAGEAGPRQRTVGAMKQALKETLPPQLRQHTGEGGDEASLSSGTLPSADLAPIRNAPPNFRAGSFADDTPSSFRASPAAGRPDKGGITDDDARKKELLSPAGGHAGLGPNSDTSNLQGFSSSSSSTSSSSSSSCEEESTDNRESSDSSDDDMMDVSREDSDGVVGECMAGANGRTGQSSGTRGAPAQTVSHQSSSSGSSRSSSNGRSVGGPPGRGARPDTVHSGNRGSGQIASSSSSSSSPVDRGEEGVAFGARAAAASGAAERGDGPKGFRDTESDDRQDGSHDRRSQRFLSQHKATDKVKKRLQKRYFEAEPEGPEVPAGENPAVETFRYDGGKVSNWRIKKWKKRRLEPAERAEAARSKSENTKGKHPKKEKTEKQKKTGQRSDLDQLEQPGFIEYGSDEEVDRLSQTDIVEAVDVTSATKHFELNLTDFGPYDITYTRNGRHLLLGGERGHVAAFDWQSKRLLFEMKPDVTNSVRWLHQETMLAAAHPSGVCFYDNLGIEVHALTDLDNVLRMEFLPHHMLLATANSKGFLGYTDVSMGTQVAGICTGFGRLDVMTHNPANAVVYLGHAAGTVTLWSPTVKNPLVKILTHKSPVRALAIDSTGNYMATSGVDKRLKVYDLRTYKMVNKLTVPMGASSLAFSQRGFLAAALGNRVQVYKDARGKGIAPYLSHVTNGSVRSVEFCPFEDVLGAGHQRGFSSLIVPGSGEANYDALTINPMANARQRANTEVRLLLDKLQPEMIGLTNWVWDLAKKSGAQKTAEPAGKVGKKQKEEEQRQRRRQSLQKRKKQRAVRRQQDADSDPLSRFRKSTS